MLELLDRGIKMQYLCQGIYSMINFNQMCLLWKQYWTINQWFLI